MLQTELKELSRMKRHLPKQEGHSQAKVSRHALPKFNAATSVFTCSTYDQLCQVWSILAAAFATRRLQLLDDIFEEKHWRHSAVATSASPHESLTAKESHQHICFFAITISRRHLAAEKTDCRPRYEVIKDKS